jgi:hypothetical protein
LFLDEAVMTKVRNIRDSATLLFTADDAKIVGNKEYDTGNYYKALEIYE